MEKNRLNWITGLKGLAAMLVFVHHFFLFFYPAFCNGDVGSSKTYMEIEILIAKTPLNILGWGGNFAVSLFFLISGFLIAYVYYVKNNRTTNIRSFFKRFFKLMFPVLFTSIIIFFVVKSGAFRSEELLNNYSKIGLNNYYNNIEINFFKIIKESIFDVFIFQSLSINPPMWTMKAELIYSIILMLFLKVFGNDKNRKFAYIFLILFNFNNYFFPFIVGCLLCDIFYNKAVILEKINRWDLKIFILILGLYFASFSYIAINTKFYSLLKLDINGLDLNVVYHNIGAAFIMLFILLSKNIKKILAIKPFVKLGEMSFCIYAFHWVIINSLSMFIVYKINCYTKYYIASIISLILTTFVVIIVSRYFNSFLNKLNTYLTNKITDKL